MTKRNKVLMALCVAGVGFVGYDLFHGKNPVGPDRASASVSDISPQPGSTDASAGLVPSVPQTVLNAAPRKSMADRLRELPEANALHLDRMRDAFTPSASWMPQAPIPAVYPEDLEKAKAQAFLGKHTLQAVMVNGSGGQAVIDDRCLKIGQKLEDFELISVSEHSAVMVSGSGIRVTFKLLMKPVSQ